jgi:hypothetical protein
VAQPGCLAGPIARVIMRQEHRKGGRGIKLLLNAAVFPGMQVCLHASDSRAVQLNCFTSILPSVLLEGSAQQAATAAAGAASAAAPASSSSAAVSPGALPVRNASGDASALPAPQQMLAFLLRFPSSEEAATFVSAAAGCKALVSAFAAADGSGTSAAPYNSAMVAASSGHALPESAGGSGAAAAGGPAPAASQNPPAPATPAGTDATACAGVGGADAAPRAVISAVTDGGPPAVIATGASGAPA